MKRLAAHMFGLALLAAVLVAMARPPRPPMIRCGNCNTANEPSRSTCRSCGASL